MYSNSKSPPNNQGNKGNNPFAGVGYNLSMSPMERGGVAGHEESRITNKKKHVTLKSSESMTEQKVRLIFSLYRIKNISYSCI